MANRKKAPENAEQIEMEKWGIPDWRDKLGYPIWDQLSKDQQRWELLRRSSKYRESWKTYCKDRSFPEGELPFGLMGGLRDPKQSWDKIQTGENLFLHPISSGGEIVYPYTPPDFSNIPDEMERQLAQDAETARCQCSFLRPDLYSGNIWVNFNLTEDLESQISKLRDSFKNAKDAAKVFMKTLEQENYDPDDYFPYTLDSGAARSLNKSDEILCIRIYDAKQCNRDNVEIVKVLSAEKSSIDLVTVNKKLKRINDYLSYISGVSI